MVAMPFYHHYLISFFLLYFLSLLYCLIMVAITSLYHSYINVVRKESEFQFHYNCVWLTIETNRLDSGFHRPTHFSSFFHAEREMS